jgi:hypothetical protein
MSSDIKERRFGNRRSLKLVELRTQGPRRREGTRYDHLTDFGPRNFNSANEGFRSRLSHQRERSRPDQRRQRCRKTNAAIPDSARVLNPRLYSAFRLLAPFFNDRHCARRIAQDIAGSQA